MTSCRLYHVTLKLFYRPGAATAVATLLVLPPANSFALPADGMAGTVAAAAVRFLGSEEAYDVRETLVTCAALPEDASRNSRALFETDGWTVVRYSEQALTA